MFDTARGLKLKERSGEHLFILPCKSNDVDVQRSG